MKFGSNIGFEKETIVDLFSYFITFAKFFFEPINAPLSGLVWDTEKCRPED